MSSNYLSALDVTCLQIEPTSKCNLACPQCARTALGKQNALLPLSELSLADYRKIFDEFSESKNLRAVFLNGNYGDAIAASNILEVIEFLKERGISRIHIITNGSLRKEGWWHDLGKSLSRERDQVTFSIDGLHDTNSIYRVNSNFEQIIANAKSFIAAGGKARWDFLAFAHNTHQIEAARELAQTLGFKAFNLKKSNRFVGQINFASNSTQIDSTGQIAAPKEKILRGEGVNKFQSLIERHGSWKNYVNQTKIECKYRALKFLYVDFEARLWPCTWVGAPSYFQNENDEQKLQLASLELRYGREFNSLRTHGLSAILAHPWFSHELVQSWGNTLDGENFKLMTCGRTCGSEYEYSSGFDKNHRTELFSTDIIRA